MSMNKEMVDKQIDHHITWVCELVETITRDKQVVSDTKGQLEELFRIVRRQAFEEGRSEQGVE